jgi:hypothetical protein
MQRPSLAVGSRKNAICVKHYTSLRAGSLCDGVAVDSQFPGFSAEGRGHGSPDKSYSAVAG